jgi:hypothetical protein
MTHEDLLSRISSRELAEWQAFSLLEPFGERRADLRAAIIASTIANANRDKDKKPEPFTPHDFMPNYETKDYALEEIARWFGDDEDGADPELQKAHLTQKMLSIFGRFKRKEGPHGDH